MSALSTTPLMIVLLALIACGLGYLIGSKRARKQRRQLQRDLNQQSLQLLDIKSELATLEKRRDQFDRKDRLLKLTLKKLASVSALTNEFEHKTQALERHHFMEMSCLQVSAAEARQQAQRAADVATSATAQLKKLEALHTQTIDAPEPKSYGQGESVKVSVVDQHLPDVSEEAVSRVSNRDIVRLSRMGSSNEGQLFTTHSLQAIDGISAELERTLNAAGIHRIEQLATMSDRELIGLQVPVTEPQSVAARANWKSGAKK